MAAEVTEVEDPQVHQVRFRMDKNGEHDESLTITPGWQGARSAKLRSGSLRAAHEKRCDAAF